MPYIKDEDRPNLTPRCEIAKNPGELTYQITVLLKDYLAANGEKYKTYAEMLGALEGAKLDLVKRKINPYEDQKQEENGDVW